MLDLRKALEDEVIEKSKLVTFEFLLLKILFTVFPKFWPFHSGD